MIRNASATDIIGQYLTSNIGIGFKKKKDIGRSLVTTLFNKMLEKFDFAGN